MTHSFHGETDGDTVDDPDASAARHDQGHERTERTGVSVQPMRRWYFGLKVVGDRLLAVLLLIVASPAIAIGALLVKLTSPGPAFYTQSRLGKDGRLFKLFKIRTMVQNAEALTGPVWAKSDDDRITGVGKALRESHVDELPQLLNVIMGDMSLVGPRPERSEFASRLEFLVPHYEDRINIRPGMTGLAQLHLPPDSDLEGVRRKLIHDLYYVRFAGFWLDLGILIATGWLLLKVIVGMLWGGFRIPTARTIQKRVRAMSGVDPALFGDLGDQPIDEAISEEKSEADMALSDSGFFVT